MCVTSLEAMRPADQFESLAAQHRDRVYREMVRVCGGRDDAEDALAEALINAYRAIDTLEDPAAFRSWLAAIGRRVCGRMKRREALRPVFALSAEGGKEIDLEDPQPTAAERAWEGELKGCLQQALDALPEENRRAFVLFELEQMSLEEAAEAEQISLPAFKSRLHRARLRLREAIETTVCAPSL